MNILQKAQILTHSGSYDSCGPRSCEVTVNSGLGGIYHAKAEHATCRLFKTLMDNSCSYDCKYCANSTSSCDKKKASYKPSELASLFIHLHNKLSVDGLFLSSGVSGNPDKATEKMIESVNILRHKHGFSGYVHLKVLPGTSYELVKQAAEVSNRLSINIEAPNKSVMSELSTCKDYKIDILRRQAWISKMNPSSGQTTQMIINSHSSDLDVLKMAKWEYTELNLRRVYYSAFKPVAGTPMENEKAETLVRETRLYNTDFLMNEYGYKLSEFSEIMSEGMLPSEDPKWALAKATFDGALDVNSASYDELIRVPGIGPKTANNIVNNKVKIKRYEQLHQLGVRLGRAKPFISVDGKRQKMLSEFS